MEETLYGIYSEVSNKFIFGIQEPSKTKARKALRDRIGKDANKYRFVVKKIPKDGIPDYDSPEYIQKKKAKKNEKRKSIKETAQYVIDILKANGIVVQRYNAYSTNSIYLKFDYGVLNSLRISDHKGKQHLAYRYNLSTSVKEPYQNQHKGYDRFYAPLELADMMIQKILFDRRTKLLKYGWANYVEYMENNIKNNTDAKGFWSQAQIV